LAGSIFGRRNFEINQRRNELKIKITTTMPLLDVDFKKFPDSMHQGNYHARAKKKGDGKGKLLFSTFCITSTTGQIEKVNVEFRNSGKCNLHNVFVKLSHPSFFTFGTSSTPQSVIDTRFAIMSNIRSPAARGGVTGGTLNPTEDNTDLSILKVPIDSLSPGESVVIPLWIRAHKTGPASFHFLWHYQSQV
jgi:hypothetical protein